jgi:hypothetical protein
MPDSRPGPEFALLSRFAGTGAHPAGWTWRLMSIPVALLCVDCLLIGLDLSRVSLGFPDSGRFRVANDRSYGELWQYGKELALGAAFFMLYRRRRLRIYAVWSALFFVFLADDALKLHETGGSLLVHALGLRPLWGLRAQDFGELAALAPVYLGLLAALVWCFRGADRRARSLSLATAVLIGVLAVFGVLGDMLHSWMNSGREFFAILEDGGEMLAMSALAALIWFELLGVPWRRGPFGPAAAQRGAAGDRPRSR